MGRIVPFCLIVLLSFSAHAEHILGGSLTYRCTGNEVYEINLTLFRACSGAPMVPQNLAFTNDCGLNFTVPTGPPTDSLEVSQLCPSQIANSTCNGGAQSGYRQYVYLTTVYLSPCNTWTMSWNLCCRQASVNVTNTPGLYIEARLNNATSNCNSSSAFTYNGVPHVCVNQPVVHDAGAVDDTAAERRFSLVDARFFGGTPFPVTYVFPYYGGEPITGMTIDQATGQLTFTPTLLGTIVTVIQVDEYDANGQWIGSVMRDLPFIVVSCSNTPPQASSGIITGTTGAAESMGDRALRACASGQFCFTAAFNDPSPSDNVTLSSNVGDVVPGATFQVSGTNPATASICASTAGLSVGTYTFLVTAEDDACPIRGQQTYTYTLNVESVPFPGEDGSALVCSVSQPFALIDSLMGTPATNGFWTGPSGPNDGQFDPSSDPAGTYTYEVSSFPGCSATAVVQVDLLPANDPYCIFLGAGELEPQRMSIYPNPASHHVFLEGAASGIRSLRVELRDMQGRPVWNTQIGMNSGTVSIGLPTQLVSGLYMVELSDPSGSFKQHSPLVIHGR